MGMVTGKCVHGLGKLLRLNHVQTLARAKWKNKLPIEEHLLASLKEKSVLDTSLHWAYSLEGYEYYTVKKDGVPMVAHNHGGRAGFEWDGGPEFFFSPGFRIKGPEWEGEVYTCGNSQPAVASWCHDHALGAARLQRARWNGWTLCSSR